MTLFSKIALRNIIKNKRRSLSTGLAIGVGFAGLCLLGGYILHTEAFLRTTSIYVNHSGHVTIYKKNGLDDFQNNPLKYHLSHNDLEVLGDLLSKNKEIEFTTPILLGMGLVSNGNKSVPFLGYGISPDDEAKIQNHPEVLKWTRELVPIKDELSIKDAIGPLDETISITKEMGTLIGREVPFNQLSDQMKDIQLAARTFDGNLNAVNAMLGFKHTTGYAMMEDTGLVAPLSIMQNLYETQGATYLAVYLYPDASISKTMKMIQSQIDKKNLDFEVFPFNDDRINLFYVGTMGFLFIMAGFFIVLIFGAVTLSIVNSTTIGIMERVRETGTMRTLGFTDSQISWLFTLESFFLTLISLSAGFVMAKLCAFLVNLMNIRFYPPGISGDMQFILTPDTWFCLSLSLPILIICLVCTYIVSKKQVSQPIIQLLQQTN